MRQRDDVHVDARGIGAELLGEGHHLLSCPLGGVREALKVERLDLKAALGHHIAGDGRVDTARKKQKPAPRRAKRHTAGASFLVGVDVGILLTHLDPDVDLGGMEVDTDAREGGKDSTPEPCRQLGRFHRKLLVPPLGIGAEAALTAKGGGKIFDGGRKDGVDILLGHGTARDPGNAEDTQGGLVHPIHIHRILKRLNDDRALCRTDREFSVGGRAAAQLLDKRALKGGAIRPLQRNLTEFTKYDFLHKRSSLDFSLHCSTIAPVLQPPAPKFPSPIDKPTGVCYNNMAMTGSSSGQWIRKRAGGRCEPAVFAPRLSPPSRGKSRRAV